MTKLGQWVVYKFQLAGGHTFPSGLHIFLASNALVFSILGFLLWSA